jgi:VWFA-related protein
MMQAACLWLALEGAFLSQTTAPNLTFRSEVRRVIIDTFVTREGRPLAGLEAGAFEVLDNGRVQENVTLLPSAGYPLSAVLVLDTSSSVRGDKLERLEEAASEFIDNLSEDDEVSVMTFGTRYRMSQEFTLDHDRARTAVARMNALGGTALLDALFAATLSAERGQGRPLVVLFSDGDDNASWLSTEELAATARRSEAVIFSVRATSGAGIRFGMTDHRAAVFIENAGDEAGGRVLEAVAAATGGQVLSLGPAANVSEAFRDVLEAMRTRYLLVYEPLDPTPGWHHLEVRLKRGIRAGVRAREGYFLR